MVNRGGAPVVVLDTKYRDLEVGSMVASEAYQVVAYAHAYGVQKVGLVYPASDTVPRAYRVKGPGGMELRTFGLDLRFGPAWIDQACECLAEQVLAWVG